MMRQSSLPAAIETLRQTMKHMGLRTANILLLDNTAPQTGTSEPTEEICDLSLTWCEVQEDCSSTRSYSNMEATVTLSTPVGAASLTDAKP
jgi:hypothetical protein